MIAVRSAQAINHCTIEGVFADGSRASVPLEGIPLEASNQIGHLAWAKARLREERDEGRKTDISLKYGVLCSTTAFVGVLLKEHPGQKPERIEIPVALPHGWEMEAGWGMSHGIVMSLSAGGHMGRAMAARASFCSSGDELMACMDACDSLCLDEVIDEPLDQPVAPGVIDMPNLGLFFPMPGDANQPELLVKAGALLQTLKTTPIAASALQQEWQEVLTLLQQEVQGGFHNWSELQKATLFSVLAEARGYGLKTDIPQELKARPMDAGALGIWAGAQRSLGIQVEIDR